MYFEKWDEIAFGSDSAMDLVDFLENFENSTISMKEIYSKSDLKEKLSDPERNDFFTVTTNGIDVEILFDQAVITLGAVIVESMLNGSADMSQVFTGSKTLQLTGNEEDISIIIKNLQDMIDNPQNHELMELCKDYIDEIITVINEIINHLKK